MPVCAVGRQKGKRGGAKKKRFVYVQSHHVIDSKWLSKIAKPPHAAGSATAGNVDLPSMRI